MRSSQGRKPNSVAFFVVASAALVLGIVGCASGNNESEATTTTTQAPPATTQATTTSTQATTTSTQATTTSTQATTTTTLDIQSLTPTEHFYLGAAALVLEESHKKLSSAEPLLARVGTESTGLTWGEIEDAVKDMGWELLGWTQIEQSEAAVEACERLLPIVDVMERWSLAVSSTLKAWDEFWAKSGDASREFDKVLDGADEVRRTLEEASSLLGDYGYAVEFGP